MVLIIHALLGRDLHTFFFSLLYLVFYIYIYKYERVLKYVIEKSFFFFILLLLLYIVRAVYTEHLVPYEQTQ